jgi:hypothetical protein
MKTKRAIGLLSLLLLLVQGLNAQNTGKITGRVSDLQNFTPLSEAVVSLENTAYKTMTDSNGYFSLNDIPVGIYTLKASASGFDDFIIYNLNLTSGNILNYAIELVIAEENTINLEIVSRSYGKKPETPLSVQNLTSEEIRSNPGGNFDISRVIQVLPGVAGNTGGGGFRNDIIIRGGGPNENVFYLDGFEIPVINHFSTQGSSGGPQGILNVAFIEEVTLNSSSFSARYDNALSSVFSFKQKTGNKNRLQGNVRLSATEFGLTLDGPLSKNTTFLISARRSYLAFLFSIIDLPIRPNYWDFQYKTTTQLGKKTTLTTLGVGAIDQFSFAVPKESSPEKEYLLRSVPSIQQWNYTIGAGIKHSIENGFWNLTLSRNMFDNAQDRFEDGDEGNEDKRALKVRSQEIENKMRFEINKYQGTWKYSYGVMGQYVKYNNSTFAKVQNEIVDGSGNVLAPALTVNFASDIDFLKYGLFGTVTKGLFENRLSTTFGLRSDMNTITNNGLDPLRTLSPRLALSYSLSKVWRLNGTIGRYYKIPIYTILGYRNANNDLVNLDNEYIGCTHYVAGIEILPANDKRITVEGFYKAYDDYPVSEFYGISLANQGADFAVVGNEPTTSIGKGRTYGMEVFFQQKLTNKWYTTISYTLVRSEFSGIDEKYVPSAWDNRHLISAVLGLRLKKGWEFGLKYRFAGGSPYTPFDENASRQNYLTTGQGTLDYTQLNTLRLGNFNQLDFRVDKKFNYDKWTLDLYLDVTNLLAFTSPAVPNYTFTRNADNSDWATTDGLAVQQNGSNAIPLILDPSEATVLPTIGFIVEF